MISLTICKNNFHTALYFLLVCHSALNVPTLSSNWCVSLNVREHIAISIGVELVENDKSFRVASPLSIISYFKVNFECWM